MYPSTLKARQNAASSRKRTESSFSNDENKYGSGRKKQKSSKENTDEEEGFHIQLYCVLFRPYFGNYWHWAFATYERESEEWHVFQVVQDAQNGPFSPEVERVDPVTAERYQPPLLHLGHIKSSCWKTMTQSIEDVAVPGEGNDWNCQDYVMDIWESLCTVGMVDDKTWRAGKEKVVPYYGQDYGGQRLDDSDVEVDDAEDEDAGGERRTYPSEEYVYDSSDEEPRHDQ